ncbi:MAG: methyl-accepting chemotaxis protein [Deltaproteobacteria bacterium]|nr:MAG: methyl-accepting chemotaxis protein [Deltaproteobacteria bacterium]
MSKQKFFGRVLGIILITVYSLIMMIELLIYFVMNATPDDFRRMIIYPIPVELVLVGSYIAIVYVYLRPVLAFLEADQKGEHLYEAEVLSVQDRCVNLAYFLAALSFPAFILGGALGILLASFIIKWPLYLWIYGLLAGIICGLLTIPISIYASNWLVEPVLARTIALLSDRDTARIAGRWLPLRNKFVMIVIVLVVSITGYTMIVGYGQTNAVLKNMEKMERSISPSVAAGFVDEIKNYNDPAIRSSRFFKSRIGSLRIFYFVLMLLSSGFGLALAFAVARETTKPVRILQTVAEQVREGNYFEPARIVSNDEFAELGGVFNQMKDTIVGQMKAAVSILETLRYGIMGMDETVSTVLSVSAEQSRGAAKQASAVQETSSTVEEMTVIAREIMERAKTVDEVASKTLSACHDGQQRLDQVQKDFQGVTEQVDAIRDAMVMLEDRFRETYRIVELMEKVAEQTELLAMNATLEAAGAGEEGRRFSVVAMATRTLAVKAREATKEIRDLVEAIQEATTKSTRIAEGGREKVAVGGSAISGVIDALQTISSLADSTSSAVREITVSTGQQTSASEQLAAAISEVNEVAGRVENGAREIESAIGRLRDFAENLRATVEEDSSLNRLGPV